MHLPALRYPAASLSSFPSDEFLGVWLRRRFSLGKRSANGKFFCDGGLGSNTAVLFLFTRCHLSPPSTITGNYHQLHKHIAAPHQHHPFIVYGMSHVPGFLDFFPDYLLLAQVSALSYRSLSLYRLHPVSVSICVSSDTLHFASRIAVSAELVPLAFRP